MLDIKDPGAAVTARGMTDWVGVDMPKSTCLLCGASPCKRTRGLCPPCYYRVKTRGELDKYPRKKLPFAEHLETAKSNETAEGCWPWPGGLSEGGYSSTSVGSHCSSAHIVAWTQANGPVPTGMELDHVCHTRSESCLGGGTCLHRRCVRPDHLEPVTRLEQQRRRKDFQSPTCKNGHDRAEHSVQQQHSGDGKWYRHCVLCRKNNQHARYLRSLRKT